MKHLQIQSNSSILIAEKQGTARKLLTDTFKSLGFENAQGVDTLKTVLNYLESKPNSWIICSLDLESEINAFQILKLITTEPILFNARVSLLLEEADLVMSPLAFSLGATSWHLKDLRPDPMKETFKAFLEAWNDPKADETKISAKYIHTALEKIDARKAIIDLYLGLSENNPQDPSLVLQLAVAQFDGSLPDEGQKNLAKAKLMGAEGWEPYAEKYLPKGTELKGKVDAGKVAIIDPDETVHTMLKAKFEEFTNSELHFFTDGQAAWNALAKDDSFELILMEWKIPTVNGPALVQRLRSGKHKFTPIVLLSTKLQKSDLNLLNELSVGDVLPKPIQGKEFLTTLVSMIGERKNPQLYRSLELAMMEALGENLVPKAESYLQRIWNNPSFAEGLKQYASGLFTYQRKRFSETCERARLSFTKGGDQLKSINLLGQALMRLEDYQGAVKCFRKAQEFSPKNLERLCAICEAEELLGNESGSDEALKQAAQLDSGHNSVVSLETKNALNDGNIALAQELFKHAGDQAHLVAELNNTGVAYIRTGSFEEGIQFYERTLQAVPPDGTEWKMKVGYNLALAYARQNKLEAAKDLLTNLTLDEKIPVAEKIKNLLHRIQKSSKEGSPFALMASATEVPKSESGTPESPWEASAKTGDYEGVGRKEGMGPLLPGDHGCFLIFKCDPQLEAKSKNHFKEIPQYKFTPTAV